MGLGKKYFDIEEPPTARRTSQAGSGILILVAGTGITNPEIGVTLTTFTTPVNNSPAFNAPSLAWT